MVSANHQMCSITVYGNTVQSHGKAGNMATTNANQGLGIRQLMV